MRVAVLAALLLSALPLCAQAADAPAKELSGWKLVWGDEFDYKGLPDKSKWGYEEGFVRNNEAQYYTRADRNNAWVENGALAIRAKKEQPAANSPRRSRESAQYTSASVTTRGKAAWNHGRIAVRAKIPTGRGMWPAIWMLGTRRTGWPACGEIDILENVGFDPDTICANVHTAKYNHVKGNNKGSRIKIDKPFADFHVYAIEWDAKKIDFFVDDQKYFTYENEGSGVDAWPFDAPHYLILNIAVGGSWGGQKGIDPSIFPQEMLIDYVRVYEKTDSQ